MKNGEMPAISGRVMCMSPKRVCRLTQRLTWRRGYEYDSEIEQVNQHATAAPAPSFVRQWLFIQPWRVPDAVRQVVEPNQVHLVAAAVSCDSQQISDGGEPRFTGQILRDVGDGNLRNRIHNNVTLVHLVTTTHLYTRTLPDANAAFDSPEPDSHAKVFGEHHIEPPPIITALHFCWRP